MTRTAATKRAFIEAEKVGTRAANKRETIALSSGTRETSIALVFGPATTDEL
jgi:hypothetical protein